MHKAVMLPESLEALAVVPGGSYIDGTLGSAGHAGAILERAGAGGRLLGIDRDPHALERAARRLEGVPGAGVLVHGAHGDMRRLALEHGFDEVDGIMLDLGVSSDQLDTPGRGFSFRYDGPLDMRMDPTRGETAAELLARLEERELAALLRELGEEPRARSVARALARAGGREPIATTAGLAEVVARATGGRRGPRHPATRVFQALRMAVNRELEELRRALEDGIGLLKPGGRFVVITFESITDRIVKRCFAAHVGRWVALQQGGQSWEGAEPVVEWVARRPREPGSEELRENPRARSAKLRAVRRI